MAGLAAAIRLVSSQRRVVVHEATAYAGGRCRSFFDQVTGLSIDNGTHLLLSGNHAALSYASTIGSVAGLQGPKEAEFRFFDCASREKWTLRFGDSRFPWWVFDKDRRVPQTSFMDYLAVARLAWAGSDRPLSEVVKCAGPIYDRLLEPLLLAALNISPPEGSAKLASALIRETLALGGKACRPLLAREGLGAVFVEPAVNYLRQRNASILFEHQLRAMRFSGARVVELDFGPETIPLGSGDAVVLAVPPYVATNLVPGLKAPTSFRGIVNAHFRMDNPPELPSMLGLINATSQWVFTHPGRISVTISDGGRLFELPKAELAQAIWDDVAPIAGLSRSLPPWQLVRERRATFAATAEQNALRPPPQTAWRNLLLAGDWTATGLPATIEGAVRSGYRAAELVSTQLREAA